MADIVISEFMDVAAIEAQLAGYDVVYDPGLVDNPAKLQERVGDARALVVRNRTQVRGDLLAAAPRLQVVGRLGVGLDNIDVEACEARGIKVCPATGANDLSVAEYVITALFTLLRGAWQATSAVSGGDWPRSRFIHGREVSGKLLGLIGYGGIARETAARADALGMRVVGYDPFLDADDPRWGKTLPLTLHALLAQADAVSLHVPLTGDTRHLLDAAALASMKKGAVVINAARGGVLDETALIASLKSGHLAGAALDVFEEEPLSPATGAKFAGIDNLFLTPHIAGVTAESNVRVSSLTLENVLKHLR